MVGLLIYYGCFMATLAVELIVLRVMYSRSGLTRDDFLRETFALKDDWFAMVLLLAAVWPLAWGYAIYRGAKAGLDWLIFGGRWSGDEILDRLFNTEDNGEVEIERLTAEIERKKSEPQVAADTLRRVQAEQSPWVRRNFGDRPTWQPVMGIQEEAGELAHAFLKREQGIRTSEDHNAAIRDALADIIIFACDVASSEGFDLTDTLSEVWENVKQRDWTSAQAGEVE